MWAFGDQATSRTTTHTKLGQEPQKRQDLADAAEPRRRLVTSVTLASGTTLTLSEPLTEAAARLGEKGVRPTNRVLDGRGVIPPKGGHTYGPWQNTG